MTNTQNTSKQKSYRTKRIEKFIDKYFPMKSYYIPSPTEVKTILAKKT